VNPYAVTLHPFEERAYLNAWMPALVERRPLHVLLDLAGDDEALRERLAAWVPTMRSAVESLRAGDGLPWSASVNFAFGVVAAHQHPVYLLGNLGLSYWRSASECPLRPYTRSASILAARTRELGAAVGEIREGFTGPGSAGSFVAAGEVFLLVRDVERRTRYFLERLQEAGYDGYAELRVLLEVMHYARANHLGVMELTHAVDEYGHPTHFPAANLRGGLRGGLSPAVDERLRQCLQRLG
jgi:hypothetical protein